MVKNADRLNRTGTWIVVCCICFVASKSQAASELQADIARKETLQLIDAYRQCCVQPEGQQPYACSAVGRFFHYAGLAKKTLAPMHRALTPRQRARLEAVLTAIFERTAEGSGHAFCGPSPTIANTKVVGQTVEVAVEVLEAGEELPSTFAFVWREHAGKWLVEDLLVEGASLITDYQNQFARIRQKEGTTGLLRRVEARQRQAGGLRPNIVDKESK